MRAKVKPDVRWHSITACAGVTFLKKVWTEVPPGREEEALNNEFLMVDLGVGQEGVAEASLPSSKPDEPETADEPAEPAEPAEPEATRAAFEMAKSAGLDLADIVGTGDGGKVLAGDVRKAIKEAGDD